MSTYTRGVDPPEPLDAVLRAASAPGHPEELAGIDVAVAAFQAAAQAPRHRRSILARVLTVKALVVGALAASTGVVLAAAGGVLPLPRPEPAYTPPADPPAATRTASDPAVPPPDGRASPSSQPDDPPKPTVGPQQGADPPCAPCPPGHEDPKPPKDKDKPGKDKDKGGPHATTPSTQPPPGGPPPGGPHPGEPPSVDPPRAPDDQTSRTDTPVSPAHGAVTAVPPNGAEPPSPGG